MLGALLACLGTVAGCADEPAGDLAGLERLLAEQRGHAVLVNFWAMW